MERKERKYRVALVNTLSVSPSVFYCTVMASNKKEAKAKINDGRLKIIAVTLEA